MKNIIDEKIQKLISNYKEFDLVKHLNMSDNEIQQNLSSIMQYININVQCENNHTDSCVSKDGYHINIFRNKNGDIECQYFLCPKINEKFSRMNIRDYYGVNNSFESYELDFNKEYIDILVDKDNRSQLLKILIYQYKTNKFEGIYLYGNTGVGKSYIMSAFLNKLAKDKWFVNFLDINQSMNFVKANFGTNDLDNYYQIIKEGDILVIDNLGIENFRNYYHCQFLIPILEYRYKNNKPTYFISSLGIEALKNKYINNIINNKGDVTKNDVFKFIDLVSGSSSINIELKGKSQR